MNIYNNKIHISRLGWVGLMGGCFVCGMLFGGNQNITIIIEEYP